MTNLVEVTIKANDGLSSGFASIKAKAAAAGTEAADAFNDAFKLRADANVTARERLKESGSLGGEDRELMNKLKSFANTPGGIGILGTGSDTSLVSMLKRQIQSAGENGGLGLIGGSSQGSQSVQDIIRQQLTGNTPGNIDTTDMIRQVIEGNSPGNYNTEDFVKQVLEGNGPSNVNTEDIIRQVIEGKTPGNLSTEDVIHEHIDSGDVKEQGGKDGEDYGTSFGSKLKSALSGILSKGGGSAGGSFLSGLLTGGGGGGDSGAISGALDSGGVAGGALPGVAGVSGMAATITGLAGALVAVLPALTAVAGGLAGIGGGFAILLETSTKFKNAVTTDLGQVEAVFKAAAMPMMQPLLQGISSLVGYFKQIEPDLKAVFADSGQLVAPLVKGFEELMSGAGPGFLAMIKSAGPVFTQMAGSFADLGKSLGEMFQDFAQDGKGSATVLNALLTLVNSLLPFLGSLGKIMVSALAPAFLAFSNSIAAVLPALNPLLKIVGQFAGAVLSDLASVLGSVGDLLVALAPSFTALAKAASGVFTAMENDGVFASLGNALEALAAPLGNLINALVKALLPALPGLIDAFSEFAKLFTGGVVIAITAVADALTAIIKAVPVPVVTALVDAFVLLKTTMLAFSAIEALPGILAAVTGAFTAMTAAMDIDTIALKAMYAWDAIVTVATKVFAAGQAILDAALDANPIGLFVIAIAALAVGIVELATHWTTVWGTITTVIGDAFTFIWDGWGKYLLPLLGPAGLIILGVIEVAQHWQTIWDGISSVTSTVWGVISKVIGVQVDYIETVIKTALDLITGNWSGAWNNVRSFAETVWNDLPGPAKTAITDVYTAIQGGMNDILGTVKSVGSNIVAFFKSLPNDLLQALSGLGDDLNSFAKNAMNLMWEGFKSVLGDIESFFENLPKDILGWLGIHSPPDWAIEAGVHIMNGIGIGMVQAKARASEATAAVAKQAASGGGNAGGPGGGAPSANAALARKLYPAWASGILWTDWNNVAMRESGWNQFARNPGSGAYGIPQALPPGKMGAAANPPESNPTAQIDWMVSYIRSTYGTPVQAWQHELNYGWYDKGGWLPTGLSLAMNNTGRPEPVGAAIQSQPSTVHVTLELGPNFQRQTGLTADQLRDLQYTVRTLGGNVQTALGKSS